MKALASLLSEPGVDRLRVAVAYANPGGVRALQTLLAALDNDVPVEIVVTLDMGITRKAALEMLLRDFSGTVGALTTGAGLGTFHAKAFVVDREGQPHRALIGSANLTDAALIRNCEAISIQDLTPAEAQAWDEWWDRVVSAADELTEDVLAGYTERRPPRGSRERIADDDVETRDDGTTVLHEPEETDARAARWLMIDWGGTGEYRVQYEFPSTAAAFFHPETDERRTITITHEGQEFSDNQLTFYPDNGMVRINLDAAIPVVADDAIRRDAALFTRLGPDHYDLHLVSHADRAACLAEAVSVGGTANTRRRNGTLREFGWV